MNKWHLEPQGLALGLGQGLQCHLPTAGACGQETSRTEGANTAGTGAGCDAQQLPGSVGSQQAAPLIILRWSLEQKQDRGESCSHHDHMGRAHMASRPPPLHPGETSGGKKPNLSVQVTVY